MNATEKLRKTLGFRMIAINVKLEAVLWPDGLVRVSALWGRQENEGFYHSMTRDSAVMNFRTYEWKEDSNIEAILDHAEEKLQQYEAGNF